ncbi:MAG: type 1 glutamine amidotransferase domain-containing protein [Halioglobus sp.]|nr:type 1 glutamine amidotransferase domain-containing protein [Halioglobus sp.]
MRVLIVLTSHGQLGDTGEKTGFWLEEFAAPYYRLLDVGAELTLASPAGGQPPIDPKSNEQTAQTAATRRFNADLSAQAALASTRRLSELSVDNYDGIFYPGGHGPLWDLAVDKDSIALIKAFLVQGKPVAAVCHAPAVLVHVTSADGSALVKGRQVTCFSNSEETAVGLEKVVPFLLEDRLRALGGHYRAAEDWQPHAEVDGLLITGQNPASSELTAELLIGKLAGQ